MSSRSSDPLIGTTIDGRYRVLRVLGRGGMGAVYEADHLRLSRRVAIKTIHPHLATKANVVERFRREAMAAAAAGSPHIVEVHDLGVLETGSPYMVMELLPGRDLGRLIEEEGVLPPIVVAHIVAQACDALSAAHAAGIVHRDVKSENIVVLERRGDPHFAKVVDFGISKLRDSSLTGSHELLGTPYAMAPEQLHASKHVDGRADVYGLGVVLYHALSGKLPFNAPTLPMLIAQIASGERAPIREAAPHVSDPMADIVETAMAMDPAKRFQSCDALRAALLSVKAEGSVPEAFAPTGATPARTPELSGAVPREPVEPTDSASEAVVSAPTPTPVSPAPTPASPAPTPASPASTPVSPASSTPTPHGLPEMPAVVRPPSTRVAPEEPVRLPTKKAGRGLVLGLVAVAALSAGVWAQRTGVLQRLASNESTPTAEVLDAGPSVETAAPARVAETTREVPTARDTTRDEAEQWARRLNPDDLRSADGTTLTEELERQGITKAELFQALGRGDMSASDMSASDTSASDMAASDTAASDRGETNGAGRSAMSETIMLNLELRPGRPAPPPSGGTGRIQIVTRPPAKATYFRGRNLGATPLQVELPTGEHELRFVMPDDRSRFGTVRIHEGENGRSRFQFAASRPADGTRAAPFVIHPPRLRRHFDGISRELGSCGLAPGRLRVMVDFAADGSVRGWSTPGAAGSNPCLQRLLERRGPRVPPGSYEALLTVR